MASTQNNPLEIRHASRSATSWKQLYEETLIGDETDVVFVFGKFDEDAPTIHAHSAILKTESSFFKTRMTDELWNSEFIKSADGKKTMMSLPADDPEVFKRFLMFLYYQTGLAAVGKLDTVFAAFKMANKYGALCVMKHYEEVYFPTLISSLANSNAVRVFFLAQKYGVTSVADAVFEFVKKNPMKALVEGKHALVSAGYGEEVLVRLLSTDSYKVKPTSGWSANELYLCKLASSWLKNRESIAVEDDDEEAEKEDTEDDEGPSSPKRARVTKAVTAIRVLQNIRFRQMTKEHLSKSFLILKNFLNPYQIGTISLVCAGDSQDNIESLGEGQKFIVNTKMRRF